MTKEQEDAVLAAAEEIKKQRNDLFIQQAADTEKKIALGEAFSEDELRYSAHARCKCGAGLAYPTKIGMHGSWICSLELKGMLSGEKHEAFPFAFYSIKSEGQPSALGATTR